MKAIRRLIKTCAANELGTSGTWLLTIIAATEDAALYRRPVNFWDAQLAGVMGMSRQALHRLRGKVVDSGWLVYEAGRRGKPARYWVTTPEHAANIDDAPSDEGDDDTLPNGQENSANVSVKLGLPRPNINGVFQDGFCKARFTETESRPNRDRIETERLLPVPVPVPVPLHKKEAAPQLPFETAAFENAWKTFTQHRRELKKPLTKTATAMALKKLAAWGESRAIAALEHTVAMGWQGLREPDESTRNGRSFKTHPHNDLERYNAPNAGTF